MNKLEIKKETDLLINALPEESDWEDLMDRIYVRQKIEKGLADSEEGRVHSLNLPPSSEEGYESGCLDYCNLYMNPPPTSIVSPVT